MHSATRTVPGAILLAIAIVWLAVHFLGVRLVKPPPPSAEDLIPAESEIAVVRASLYNSQLNLPDVPQFTLPREFAATTLLKFRQARPLEDQTDQIDLQKYRDRFESGMISITLNDGRHIDLRFYWVGKGALVFTFGRGDIFYGADQPGRAVDSEMVLEKAIRDIYTLQQKQGKNAPKSK